jgi:hypothetical protein
MSWLGYVQASVRIFGGSDDIYAWIEAEKQARTMPPAGWTPAFWDITDFRRVDATKTYWQNDPQLPVTMYGWEDWEMDMEKPWDKMNNLLKGPDDPFNMEMFITYGPMTLYDVDRMIQAEADEVELDQSYYYDAYWFTLNTRGTTVAMRNGDIVLQYMAIENQSVPGNYEQWSCLGTFVEQTTSFDGSVYNYDYTNKIIDGPTAIANGDNIDFQTIYHPLYNRNGPWTMAASTKYYTTYFAPHKDQTGISCTGVRRTGAPNGARVNLQVDDVVVMNLGYRVYADENDTAPRLVEDYDKLSFILLGASNLAASAVAVGAVLLATF